MRHPYLKILSLVFILLALTGTAFYLATIITSDPTWQATVRSFGPAGMVLVAFLASLNALIPLPPATFAPIFLSAGSSLADSVSYVLGRLGRKYTADHHPKLVKDLTHFFVGHHAWILPATYLYMAFSPFPNEYIMIPLALIGFRYPQIIIPLVLGNLFHHTWMIYGYESIFEWFF
jgi:hypothetical protein